VCRLTPLVVVLGLHREIGEAGRWRAQRGQHGTYRAGIHTARSVYESVALYRKPVGTAESQGTQMAAIAAAYFSGTARRFEDHLSVTTINDAAPPQTRTSHPSPSMRSTHITVSPAAPKKGLH
jgi:hypothetical protein